MKKYVSNVVPKTFLHSFIDDYERHLSMPLRFIKMKGIDKMKKIGKIIAILLTAAIAVTMFVLPTSAAGISSAKTFNANAVLNWSAPSTKSAVCYLKMNFSENGKAKFSIGSQKTTSKSKYEILNSAGKRTASGKISTLSGKELSVKKGTYYLKLTLQKGQYVKKLKYTFTGNSGAKNKSKVETVYIQGKPYKTDITELDLCYTWVTNSDIKDLYKFDKLESLNLGLTLVDDLSVVSKITSLKSLSFSGGDLADLSGISKLVNLEELDLADTKIKDISSVKYLKKLKRLDISFDNIYNINDLLSMNQLEFIGLNKSHLSDYSVLAKFHKLKELHLRDCGITNIDFLKTLTNLEHLDLGNNFMFDFPDPSGKSKVNYISDISVLSNLTKLTWLDISRNNFKDVEALKNCKKLSKLGLEDNLRLNDVKALHELKSLTYVNILNTGVSSSDAKSLEKALPDCLVFA